MDIFIAVEPKRLPGEMRSILTPGDCQQGLHQLRQGFISYLLRDSDDDGGRKPCAETCQTVIHRGAISFTVLEPCHRMV